ATAHFRAAPAAADLHPHAFRAKALRALDRLLHCASEGDPLFELIGDAARDEHGIDLGLADLLYGHADALARLGFERAAQLFDFDAALADHDAGLRSMNGDGNHVRRAFDLNFGHAGVGHAGQDVLADAVVLEQEIGILLTCREPAAVPVFDRSLADFDAEAEADRVNLLSHLFLSSLLGDHNRNV